MYRETHSSLDQIIGANKSSRIDTDRFSVNTSKIFNSKSVPLCYVDKKFVCPHLNEEFVRFD